MFVFLKNLISKVATSQKEVWVSTRFLLTSASNIHSTFLLTGFVMRVMLENVLVDLNLKISRKRTKYITKKSTSKRTG